MHAKKKKSKQKINEIFYSAPHWLKILFEIHWMHFQHIIFCLMGIVWFQLFQYKLMSRITTVAVILKLSWNSVFLISPTFQVCHKMTIGSLHCLVIHFTHILPNTQLTFWCLILFDSTLQPMVLSKITAPMLLHSFVSCHYRPVIAVFIVAS